MNINYQGEGNFKIKAKEGNIILGEKIQINEFTIPGAGEFEVAGISAESIDGIFTFQSEDMNLTYLKRKNILDDKELERVKDTDILFVPISEWLETKTAIEVINQIEPKIVIPMFYKNVDDVKLLGDASPEIIDLLKISKANLPVEDRRIIAINKQ